MARSTFTNRQTLAAGLGTSLLVSSLTVALGVCVLDDVNTRDQRLMNQYLQRRQVALAAGEELARETRSPLGTSRDASSHGVRWSVGNASVDPQDVGAQLAPLARALHAYETGGPLRGDEAKQIFFVRGSLVAYRKALKARQDLQYNAQGGGAVPSDAAALEASVVATRDALSSGFQRLASLAGDRASEIDGVLSEAIVHLSRLLLLIGALAVLAGIPPALWVMRKCGGETSPRPRNLRPTAVPYGA